MEIFDGTWLKIKKGSDYCPPEFIEFENNQIIHFRLEKKSVGGLSKKVHERIENFSINKINKRLNIEGRKLVLKKLQGTYFASMYENGERSTLIGIKEIDEEKAILFGFPETPYQITAK